MLLLLLLLFVTDQTFERHMITDYSSISQSVSLFSLSPSSLSLSFSLSVSLSLLRSFGHDFDVVCEACLECLRKAQVAMRCTVPCS